MSPRLRTASALKQHEGGGLHDPPPSCGRCNLREPPVYWSGITVALCVIVSVTGAALLKKIVPRVSVAK